MLAGLDEHNRNAKEEARRLEVQRALYAKEPNR